MLKKIFKLLFGLALLPAAVFAVWNFCKELAAIPLTTPAQAMFLYGVAAYAGFHIFIFKPAFLYVFGHESTHALTSKLFGGRIFAFKVSSKGGKVKTDKENTGIALAPYVVPFYTLIVCAAYLAGGVFRDVRPYTGYFVFALGATLAFHLAETADTLRTRQTDIVKSGYIFSMPIIILVNIAITAGIMGLLFAEFSFKNISLATLNQTRDFYTRVWEQMFM